MGLEDRLAAGRVIILDGATGTELERRGVPMDDVAWSGIASLSHPDTLRAIHGDYIAAGAEVVITNTFATSRYLLEASGLTEHVRAANEAAVALAKEARERAAGQREVWIAGSISPMAPAAERGRRPDLATVAASFREQTEILAQSGVDLLVLEMMRDLDYARAAVDAAAATGLPVWVGFSCAAAAGGEVVMAPGIADDLPFGRVLEPVMARGGSLVAIMHSEVEVTRPALAVARRHWRGPLGAYPHSGRFVMPHWQFDGIISPAADRAAAEHLSRARCCHAARRVVGSARRSWMDAMSHVFSRQPTQEYPVAVAGDGIAIVDREGRRYLDASGGAAVSCLGHSHPRVIAAIKAQVERLAYAHTSFFTSEPAEQLADQLIASAPAGINRVYFVSGGSEAVEAALKMARQYFVEIGQPERRRFIARRQSYHGNTLGALAVGGNAWRRRQFEPLLAEVAHVSPCYPYRGRAAGESEEAYGARLAAELEATVQELGPETVIGFVAEPVVGATMGAVPAVPGYFEAVRAVCDRHGMLLILDEVMCGMGRTGTLFACEQEGVRPDLVTVAKGLGAGYQPIGATLVARPVFEAIRDGSGFFQHGHTYMGHPLACAAALAVQQTIAEEQLLGRVRQQGARLRELLSARFGAHPNVGEIRGRGLFQGLEFVADRASKRPFAPERRLHARIKAEAMARGLLCYPMGGTIDGRAGDHLLLAPPYIVSDGELDEIVERLAQAIAAALAAVGRAAA